MIINKWDGTAITAPGVYSGVTMKAYHGPLVPPPHRSVSRSVLWTMFDKSARHAWEKSPFNPDHEPEADSEPMLFGRAAHHLLLGEADFTKHFAVRPEEFDSWRTKDAKLWREMQEKDGFDVLIPSNLDAIRGMAGGLAADPMVRAGILNGLIEHTMVAQDPKSGLWLKIRPDAIPTDSGDYSDLKTCADITDDGLEAAIGRDGLFMQGAMVRYVARLLGLPFTSFTLVFSEKSAPFCTQTRTLIDSDLDLGEDAMHAALALYAKCMKRDVWPGPGGDSTDAAYIAMKPYHRKQIELRIEKMENDL